MEERYTQVSVHVTYGMGMAQNLELLMAITFDVGIIFFAWDESL